MGKGRLEAFSDGVIAILITIMVLELKVPEGVSLQALGPLAPLLLTYALSFVLIGIYWNNHHHMLHATDRVDGRILWANLHLLFWLSLVPFVTGWMGENHFAALPVAAYGTVLLLAGIAYYILVKAIIREGARNPRVAAAIGRDIKGKISIGLYVVAIPMAFLNRFVSAGLYVAVVLMWLVPDRRIETRIEREP